MAELALRAGVLTHRPGFHREGTEEDTSDEMLAESVRATGDIAAFSQLVDRYRGRVIALARRILAGSNSDEAEDIAQEAFISAYDKRASFRSGERYRPWLYRIAVNRCLDRLRAQCRRPVTVEFGSLPELSCHNSDPLAYALLEESEKQLEQAIADLPPKLRAVFVLRHLDDLSYTEIAVVTGLPIGTVKTYLFRARAALRAALKGYLSP